MTSYRATLLTCAIAPLLYANAQTLQWAHATGSASQEHAKGVAIDANGNVITVGSFVTSTGSSIDLNPGPGTFNVSSISSSQDIFVRKVDANGNFLWGAALGGITTDEGWAVAIDLLNNVIITGRIAGTVDLDPTAGVFTVSTSNTGFDVFVVKLSPTGSFLWGRIFGGSSPDTGRDIGTDAAGNVYTTGQIGGVADLDPGAGVATQGGNGLNDIFIQKLDASGNFVWGVGIGGTANDIGWSIAVTPTGHAVIAGEFRNTVDFDPSAVVLNRVSAGDADMFLMRLDAAAILQWAHRFGGTGTERARAVAVDALNNCVFTGFMTSQTDMDPGAPFVPLAGSFNEDSFVAKLTGTGLYLWSFLLTGFLNEGRGIAVDAQNNIYATGTFSGTTDVDPGLSVVNLVPSTGRDGYVLRYAPGGTLDWSFQLNAPANMDAEAIAVDSNASIAIVGGFPGSMDMQPGAGTTNIVSAGMSDAYTALYTQPGGPLSVELVAFSGERLNAQHVRLDWSTTTEQDNSGFELWRLRQGEGEFQLVGWVNGAGHSQSTLHYSLIDPNATALTSYYRMRQVDYDGTSEDSPVVVVHGSAHGNAFAVFPNPASEVVNVGLDRALIASVELLDGSGRAIRTWPARTELGLHGIASGMHMLRLRMVNGTMLQQLLMVR